MSIHNDIVYKILYIMIDTAPLSIFSHEQNPTDEIGIDYILATKHRDIYYTDLNLYHLFNKYINSPSERQPTVELNIALIIHAITFYTKFGYKVCLYDFKNRESTYI